MRKAQGRTIGSEAPEGSGPSPRPRASKCADRTTSLLRAGAWAGLAAAGLVWSWSAHSLHGADAPKAPSAPTESPGAARTSTPAPPPTPVLPVVERAPARQPVVGLASDTHLDRTPPRATRGLDFVKLGWSYNCMECHRLLESKWHRDAPMVEHGDIQLEHGNNRFCLNCHHPKNRNAFVDYDGSEIAESRVVELCAKCHGPTYRDWEAGVHGRRNGHWNAAQGPRTQLRCIQCHDPHQPRFQPMKPLSPPTYPARAPGAGGRADLGHAASSGGHVP